MSAKGQKMDAKQRAVIRAAKAVGAKRQPSPSDDVMWEHWLPKYTQRISAMVDDPVWKDVRSYAETLTDLAQTYMRDVPAEQKTVQSAGRFLYRATAELQKGNTDQAKMWVRQAAQSLRGLL